MKSQEKTFNLRRKLVLFVGILALITYSTSFIFIEYFQPMFFESMNRNSISNYYICLGISWSCLLAGILVLLS